MRATAGPRILEMERPLSAPAVAADYCEGLSRGGTGEDEEAAATVAAEGARRADDLQAFAEMETRAANAMGGDNRGHKRSLSELAEERPSLLPRGPRARMLATIEEADFGQVERGFMEAIAYRKNSATSGLSNREVRLLHSEWSRLARMRSDAARCALGAPSRLSEALNSSAVRNGLSGATLRAVSQAVLDFIVDINCERVRLLRLQDALNTALSALEDGGGATDGLGDGTGDGADDLQMPGLETVERERILAVLALSSHRLRTLQQMLDTLALVRAGLVSALEYGQIVGRFLAKRLRRTARRRIAASRGSSENLSVTL